MDAGRKGRKPGFSRPITLIRLDPIPRRSPVRPGSWRVMTLAALALSLSLLPWSSSRAEEKCLNAKGSAAIIGEDIPSAKLEASARARWAALEEAAGVEVRSQTLVANAQLLDNLVSVKARGTIISSKEIEVIRESEIYNVTMKVCVEPTKAADTIASLALNNSVAVFVPSRRPKVLNETESTSVSNGVRSTQSQTKTVDEQEETNIFSENLIGKLVDQGYTVTDIAPTKAVDAEAVEQAMRSGNFLTMRSLIGRFLSNVLLVGKVDYTVSQKKGEDIGYDVSMPYNRVTVRLTYRLLTRDQDSGKLIILGAGTADAKGMAGSVEDAVANGMQSLSDKMIPQLLEKFAKHIKGVSRKITVKVDGLDGMAGTFDVKSVLNGISWVSSVEAVGLNEFLVSYPENSIYLANSLSRSPGLKVADYSPYLIHLKYQK